MATSNLPDLQRDAIRSTPFFFLRWMKEGYEHALGTHGPTAAVETMRSQAHTYLPLINAELDSPARRVESLDYIKRHKTLPPCPECERKIVIAEGHAEFVDEFNAMQDRLNRWVD